MNITQKRLIGEIKNLEKNREPYYQVVQDPTNIFLFYFMLKGDDSSPYKDGYYIGKIVLPPNYPTDPGDFYMLTPSGRFNINSKICLTNSSYHRDTWSPMWNIQNMVIGFVSVFVSDDTSGISHIKESAQQRKQKAFDSVHYNMENHRDIFLRFTQFVNPDGSLRTQNEINQSVAQARNKSSGKAAPQPVPAEELKTEPQPQPQPVPTVEMKKEPEPQPDLQSTTTIPSNYNQWIEYVRNSSLRTFDPNIFKMEFEDKKVEN